MALGCRMQQIQQQPQSQSATDINVICVRTRETTQDRAISQFLAEPDALKALAIWLDSFVDTAKLFDVVDIQLHIARSIADLDQLINAQLSAMIHHPDFKRVESAWRGLELLTQQVDANRNIKIRVLDISWAEVCRDLEKALEFDQSLLFQKIYSEEYGTPGGEPYGVLIGDYQISHKRSLRHPQDDLAALEAMSRIAAAAFAPFIVGASSELFGLDDFATLAMPLNLAGIFSQTEYVRWRSLRDKPDSRFVGLVLPQVLLRPPYSSDPGDSKGFYYRDNLSSAHRASGLWGNASYAFAAVLLREFANVGWFGHIRGAPRDQLGGGLVTCFTNPDFSLYKKGLVPKPIVDVVITDAQERDLSDLGLIALCHCYDTPLAAFYSNQSLLSPQVKQGRKGADKASAKLAAMLQHVLCASRIAHYLKVMIRDKVGSFITADECERYLSEWLFRYTTGRDDLAWEEQALYPLRQASVKVDEHPEKPGQYVCVIHLMPHYQLDNMVSEMELVTELMQAG